MSITTTHSTSFTITNARYIASKIKTDLKLIQRRYGAPNDLDIDNYGEEAAQLLKDGYLGTVTYGFRRAGNWIVAIKYTAHNGTLVADDRAGGIPLGIDISEAHFLSYLTYSESLWALPASDREKYKKSLPVSRTEAAEPGSGSGYWVSDRGYSSNGTGVARETFKTL